MKEISMPVFQDKYYNINDYGASSDGHTLNTDAFRLAIEACAVNGGGHVIVPKGCYMTGPIHLLSNVDLHLEAGAYILFTREYDRYPLIMTYYEGYPTIRCTSPLWATDAENIAITGEGTLDGSGEAWWYVRRWEQSEEMWNYLLKWCHGYDDNDPDRHIWWPTDRHKPGNDYFKQMHGLVDDFTVAEKYKPFFRPCMVELKHCRRILLEGITVQNSPAWSVHPFLCEDLRVNNIFVKAPWDAPNTDGLNMECTQNAYVTNSTFDVGDDAICAKAGKNAAGRKIGVPTQHIHVEKCNVYAAHGGFTIGTETACSIRDILVEDCTFTRTDRGLRFKSCYGRGGIIENVVMRNINMHNIIKEAVSFIMSRDLGAMPSDTPRNPDGSFIYAPDDLPVFRNITMENIVCHGALNALMVKGLPLIEVKDVLLRNGYFRTKQGIHSECVNSFKLENTIIENEYDTSERYEIDNQMLGNDTYDCMMKG